MWITVANVTTITTASIIAIHGLSKHWLIPWMLSSKLTRKTVLQYIGNLLIKVDLLVSVSSIDYIIFISLIYLET